MPFFDKLVEIRHYSISPQYMPNLHSNRTWEITSDIRKIKENASKLERRHRVLQPFAFKAAAINAFE